MFQVIAPSKCALFSSAISWALEFDGLIGWGHALSDKRACSGALPYAARPDDAKAAARIRLAFDADLAFEQFDYLARYRKAKPRSTVSARQAVVNLPEFVEDVGQRLARYADACIFYFQTPVVLIVRGGADDDASGGRELDGIADQV